MLPLNPTPRPPTTRILEAKVSAKDLAPGEGAALPASTPTRTPYDAEGPPLPPGRPPPPPPVPQRPTTPRAPALPPCRPPPPSPCRLILASFVTTWMEPEAQKIIMDSLNVNLIDVDEYPYSNNIHDR